ncbi:hypothetical protein T06_624 [Trichinella sp. T6]|nr:hypothetical protein T06_624 [Trichinella sp. T6]
MLHTDLFAAKHLSLLGGCCCQLIASEDRLLCAVWEVIKVTVSSDGKVVLESKIVLRWLKN